LERGGTECHYYGGIITGYHENGESGQKTISGIDDMLIKLDKKDATAYGIKCYGVPVGAVGAPTIKDVLALASQIIIVDGPENLQKPSFEVDGLDIDSVLQAIQLHKKSAHLDDDGSVIHNNFHAVVDLTATDGLTIVWFDLERYFSQMEDPYLYIKWRDPTTFFAYGTTDPTAMTLTVKVLYETGSYSGAEMSVARGVKPAQLAHSISNPKSMVVFSKALLLDSGYAGTILSLISGDNAYKVEDADLIRYIEIKDAMTDANYSADVIFVSNVKEDETGSIDLKLDTVASALVTYFFGQIGAAKLSASSIQTAQRGTSSVGVLPFENNTRLITSDPKLKPLVASNTINTGAALQTKLTVR